MPEFRTKPEDAEIFIGESINFVADVKTNGSVKVDWLGGEELLKSTDRISISSSGSKHELKISNANIDDEGFYKCIVQNDAGKIECEFELLVEGETFFLDSTILFLGVMASLLF